MERRQRAAQIRVPPATIEAGIEERDRLRQITELRDCNYEVRSRYMYLCEYLRDARRSTRRKKRPDGRKPPNARPQSPPASTAMVPYRPPRPDRREQELLRRCQATLRRLDDDLEDGLDPDELSLLRELDDLLGTT